MDQFYMIFGAAGGKAIHKRAVALRSTCLSYWAASFLADTAAGRHVLWGTSVSLTTARPFVGQLTGRAQSGFRQHCLQEAQLSPKTRATLCMAPDSCCCCAKREWLTLQCSLAVICVNSVTDHACQ